MYLKKSLKPRAKRGLKISSILYNYFTNFKDGGNRRKSIALGH
jgi:hypothetical protein